MSDKEKIPILLVDDREENLLALESLLEDPALEQVRAGSGEEALRLALRRDFALVLLDAQMPGMDGFETAELMRGNPKTRHIPIIFVTGVANDAGYAFKGYDTGAVDYLTKPIVPAAVRAKVKVFSELYRQRLEIERYSRGLETLVEERTADLRNSTDQLRLEVVQRRRAEELLQEKNEELDRFFALAPDLLCIVDTRGVLRRLNRAWERTLGYALHELEGTALVPYVHPGDVEQAGGALRDLAGGAEARHFDARCRCRDGSYRWVEWHFAPCGNHLLYGAARDVTERKLAEQARVSLEGELRQAQKMEAVGRLAGGIAHDFNNLLTAILGNCDLLAMQEGVSTEVLADVGEIRAAGERAASLTRQLLAFSRKQLLQPRVFNLNDALWEIQKMIGRLLGDHIAVVVQPSTEAALVRADPGQVQQVILNLSVNARDAMPEGGTLTLATTLVDGEGGPHVVLQVSDTGCGMDAATKAQLFEPFFTTKELGKGTGLGLATVHGIVSQSGGRVSVESEPGRGSTFRVYFPRVPTQKGEGGGHHDAPPPGGSETVLVVEDSHEVRTLLVRILRSLGYRVLEASAGEQALAAADAESGPLHLVLTDLMMPGLGGRALAEKLSARRPSLKVLCMSGHADNPALHDGLLGPDFPFIQKPFRPSDLARRVRELLDEGSAATRETDVLG